MFARYQINFRHGLQLFPVDRKAKDSTKHSQSGVDGAGLQLFSAKSFHADLGCEIGDVLACDFRKQAIAHGRAVLNCADARIIPSYPCPGSTVLKPALRPWLKAVLNELAQSGLLLFADADQSFRESGPMRSFNLARNLVIALLRGFTDQATMPHELVPVHLTSLVNGHRS